MKTPSSRVRFNCSEAPSEKQGDDNTAKSADVNQTLEMLSALPLGKKTVALRLIDLLADEAAGKSAQPNFLWDCLPEILSWRRNDKFRLARAFRKTAKRFLNAQRVDLAKRFEYWAERIHMFALYCKHPDLMRPLIKSCMPAGNQADDNREEMEIFESTAKVDRALRALPAAERKKAIDALLKVCMCIASETGDVSLDRVIHKNFFLVNMSQREQKELRELANAFGIELRGFLANAIRDSKSEYAQMLRIAKGAELNPQFVFSLVASVHNNN